MMAKKQSVGVKEESLMSDYKDTFLTLQLTKSHVRKIVFKINKINILFDYVNTA